MGESWRDYEHSIASLFERLALTATVGETLKGARASHKVDVTVRHDQLGIKQLWIVECKDWNRPVSKDKVLTLAQIVADLGADRGFLFCERGFQSGAMDVAFLSNITLTDAQTFTRNTDELSRQLAIKQLGKMVSNCLDRVNALWRYEPSEHDNARRSSIRQTADIDPLEIMGLLSFADTQIQKTLRALEDGKTLDLRMPSKAPKWNPMKAADMNEFRQLAKTLIEEMSSKIAILENLK